MNRYEPKPQEYYDTIATTLGEHGTKLLYAEDPSLEFKPYNAAAQRELSKILSSGKAKKKMQGGRIFEKVLYVLQHMCVKFAGKELWRETDSGYKEVVKTPNERMNWIAQHTDEDVLLAYILLYKSEVDDLLEIDLDLEGEKNGKEKTKVEFDLNEVNIKGATSLEDALWSYDLQRPIKIRGEAVHQLVLGPTKFSAIRDVPLADNQDEFDAISPIAGSIYYIPGVNNDQPLTCLSVELNQLHIKDLKKIQKLKEKYMSGLEQKVEMTEVDTGEKIFHIIPWYSPDFLV